MMLLLGCVVMCEGKGPLIEKMKGMELLQQQALVAHIQQVLVITNPLCFEACVVRFGYYVVCACVCVSGCLNGLFILLCILQITDTTEYVCSVDWTELEDLPKS